MVDAELQKDTILIRKLKDFRSKLTNTHKIIIFFVCNLLALLMVFSRLVLGVHAINQVLYGSLLGYWTFIFVHLYLRPFLMVHIKRILDREPTNKLVKYWVLMAFLIFFNAWSSNLWVLLYLVRSKAFDLDFTNIDKCLADKGQPIKTPEDVQVENYRACGIILFGFAAYAGVAYREYVVGEAKEEKTS